MCVVNLPVEKHIVSDQIAQVEGLCTVVELTAENVSRILEEAAEFIYSSAEQVLENMCEWVFFKLHKQVVWKLRKFVMSICEVHRFKLT